MLQPLDGPSKSDNVNVGAVTPVEVKKGATAFEDRKVVTIQPDGLLYVYLSDDNETPSAATITASGFKHYKGALRSYEASASQAVWVISDTGTINIRFSERA